MLALLLAASNGTLLADQRPNIVMIFADDWGRYAGIYGRLEPGGLNDVVRTPNFDRIAKEGVLFRNAFVNAPSCTPCRSSLLSGQYFWRTGRGAILNGAEWDPKIPSYPLMLRDAGYHIGFTYKVWGPGTPPNAPYGGNALAYVKKGNQFNQFSQNVTGKPDVGAAKQVLYEQVRGNFQDFLKARPEGAPFCYWFGPTNTHRKWIKGSGKGIWGIDPDSLKGKVPADLPDVPEVREDLADYLGEVQALDAGIGVILDELQKTGEFENTLIVISGDHGIPGVPRGKCNLYDLGTSVSLAIRWGKEIPGGRVVDDFVCLPDLCPTFLEAAGVKSPATMTARSLLPLLKSDKQGQVEPDRNFVVIGRERHVAGARSGNLPYPQRAIRTNDFLYIRNFKPERWPLGEGPGFGQPDGEFPDEEALTEETYAAFADMDASPTKAWVLLHRKDPLVVPFFERGFALRPEEELYDLRRDPAEMVNVASDPNYARQKDELSQRLMTLLTETGDPRVTGSTTQYDEPPFTLPNMQRETPGRQGQRRPANTK